MKRGGGTLFDYQNVQKVPDGYRFRLTLFWGAITNSVNICGRGSTLGLSKTIINLLGAFQQHEEHAVLLHTIRHNFLQLF
jgi:hypothetical protein